MFFIVISVSWSIDLQLSGMGINVKYKGKEEKVQCPEEGIEIGCKNKNMQAVQEEVQIHTVQKNSERKKRTSTHQTECFFYLFNTEIIQFSLKATSWNLPSTRVMLDFGPEPLQLYG